MDIPSEDVGSAALDAVKDADQHTGEPVPDDLPDPLGSTGSSGAASQLTVKDIHMTPGVG